LPGRQVTIQDDGLLLSGTPENIFIDFRMAGLRKPGRSSDHQVAPYAGFAAGKHACSKISSKVGARYLSIRMQEIPAMDLKRRKSVQMTQI